MGNALSNVSMRAVVPLVCKVGFSVTGDGTALGVASQLCNNPNGYTLHALATGDVDGAFLVVDGARIALQSGREVTIGQSSGPARKLTPVGYEPGDGSEGGNLELRIEAN